MVMGCGRIFKVATKFDFGDGNGPVPAHQHRNLDGSLGGWGADSAHVAETVFVDKYATVCGKSTVLGHVEMWDNARVMDNATVLNHVKIFDDAVVCDSAYVVGNAVLQNKAVVGQRTTVQDHAVIRGTAKVFFDEDEPVGKYANLSCGTWYGKGGDIVMWLQQLDDDIGI